MPTKVSNIGIKKRTPYKRRKLPGKKSVVKTIFLSGLTIIVASLFLAFISIYKFINAPFSSAHLQGDIIKTDGVWGKDDLNLMVIRLDDKYSSSSNINSFSLLNFDIINRRYNIYTFPLQEEFLYVNDTKGTLSGIYKYVKTENKNIDFIVESFFRQFAVKPDGYIVLDNNDYKYFEDKLGGDIPFRDLSAILRVKNTFMIPGMISAFRDKVETNLTLSDMLSALQFFKNTSETSTSINEISKYGILDHDVWDQVWNDTLSYESIKKEHMKVLILNGSKDPKIPGLASWGARVVRNIGISVLDTENSFEDFTSTAIIASNKDLNSVKELATAFNVPYIIGVEELDKSKNYNPQIFRAEITLVVVNYSQ